MKSKYTIVQKPQPLSKKGAVILLAYNNHKDALECIQSLKNNLDDDLSIVLVDNNSKYNVAKHVSKEHRGVHCLRAHGNRGYAGGNNIGAAYASQGGSNLLYFINDDTIVRKNFWKSCRRQIKSSAYDIVGSVIVEYNEPRLMQECGVKWDLNTFHRQTLGAGEAYDKISNKTSIGCDSICGAGFMIPTRVFNKLGGFDESFFYLFEDSDLSLRAKKNGFSVGVACQSVVLHKGSQTVGSSSPFAAYHAVRNHLWMCKRHTTSRIGLAFGVLRNIKTAARFLRLSSFDSSVCKSVCQGWINGVINTPS